MVNPCHSQLLLALRKCWRELELYKAPSVAMKSALELFFIWFVYTWFLLAIFFFRIEFDDRFHRPSDLLGVQESIFGHFEHVASLLETNMVSKNDCTGDRIKYIHHLF